MPESFNAQVAVFLTLNRYDVLFLLQKDDPDERS